MAPLLVFLEVTVGNHGSRVKARYCELMVHSPHVRRIPLSAYESRWSTAAIDQKLPATMGCLRPCAAVRPAQVSCPHKTQCSGFDRGPCEYTAWHVEMMISLSLRWTGSASMRGCQSADILKVATGDGRLKLPRVEQPFAEAGSTRQDPGTIAISSDWRAILIASGYPGTTTVTFRFKSMRSSAPVSDLIAPPSCDATT